METAQRPFGGPTAFAACAAASASLLLASGATAEPADALSAHAADGRRLTRLTPARAPSGVLGRREQQELFRLEGPGAETVVLRSLSPSGAVVEQLSVQLAPCAEHRAVACSAPLQLSADPLARRHPGASRTLLVELGGSVRVDGATAPRFNAPVAGPYGDFRLALRAHVLRTVAGGPPPFGDDDASALRLVRAELTSAAERWAQCGVRFTDAAPKVVDPPPPSLIVVGCTRGLPASRAGELRFEVGGRRQLRVPVEAGDAPALVARRLERTLTAAGYFPRRTTNARVPLAALPTFDVAVRDRRGHAVPVRALPSEPTGLAVCVPEVELRDGLDHFTDDDAAAGSLEERALLHALDDADPRTVDVLFIGGFAGPERLAEAFVHAPRTPLGNALIVEHEAVLAGERSSALAHELGHILLDVQGHPDDGGVDRSSLLMDADASDPTVFGPRWLTRADCARVALLAAQPGSPLTRE